MKYRKKTPPRHYWKYGKFGRYPDHGKMPGGCNRMITCYLYIEENSRAQNTSRFLDIAKNESGRYSYHHFFIENKTLAHRTFVEKKIGNKKAILLPSIHRTHYFEWLKRMLFSVSAILCKLEKKEPE